jgi:hypothetical protein
MDATAFPPDPFCGVGLADISRKRGQSAWCTVRGRARWRAQMARSTPGADAARMTRRRPANWIPIRTETPGRSGPRAVATLKRLTALVARWHGFRAGNRGSRQERVPGGRGPKLGVQVVSLPFGASMLWGAWPRGFLWRAGGRSAEQARGIGQKISSEGFSVDKSQAKRFCY